MPVVVVVGCQWGDEGKGKIVDLLAAKADVVARYQGGPNAGHTVVRDGRTFVLHLLPTGALHPHVHCVLGNGVVVDPDRLSVEIADLEGAGFGLAGRLTISAAAHTILPYHIALDTWYEQGARRVGSTRRGIGPAYTDKARRVGVRIGDLLRPESLRGPVGAIREEAERLIGSGAALAPVADVVASLAEAGRRLAPFVGDASVLAAQAIADGRRLVLEGAQGTLLDLDHGSYPFVTSSNATAGGACTGLGIGPTRIDAVWGVTKAYSTRVGDGPFVTEESGTRGDELRKAGGEFGATTGRPRRCGWLDFVVLRHAVRVNGLDGLAVTKLDVLDDLDSIPVATHYDNKSGSVTDMTSNLTRVEETKPVYRIFQGWRSSTRSARSMADLPVNARRYLDAIEEACGVPIVLVSVGSGAEATIETGAGRPIF
jgi:adenylosuccinate synthase